jgi:serine protease
MASPHVAGVAALVKAAGVDNPDDVVKIIKQSARKVQEDPLNHFGAGQLDAAGAVQLALKGQITFRDFFRWLRDNGYINPRFWIDGGVVALLPKILMVLGSYLLAWFLRNYLPWIGSWALTSGMVAGSCGLFFLRGIYIFDLPHWPLALLSSSLPELGSAVLGRTVLNPFFASVLIPFLLLLVLMGSKSGKLFALGSCLGVASCLTVSAALSPSVWGLGDNAIARTYLVVNALLCFGLAYLTTKGEKKIA